MYPVSLLYIPAAFSWLSYLSRHLNILTETPKNNVYIADLSELLTAANNRIVTFY